jgi:hypothetical protein
MLLPKDKFAKGQIPKMFEFTFVHWWSGIRGTVNDSQGDDNHGECEEQIHFYTGQCPGSMGNDWPIQIWIIIAIKLKFREKEKSFHIGYSMLFDFLLG